MLYRFFQRTEARLKGQITKRVIWEQRNDALTSKHQRSFGTALVGSTGRLSVYYGESPLTESYVKGECHDAPLLKGTIGEALTKTTDKFGDRLALHVRHQNLDWTWRCLSERVDMFAHGLLKLGIGKGDRVGIWASNRGEWILTQYALARIGAVMVTVNPSYRPAELSHALKGMKALICDTTFKNVNFLHMLHEMYPELQKMSPMPDSLNLETCPSLKHIIHMSPINPSQASSTFLVNGMWPFDEISVNRRVLLNDSIEKKELLQVEKRLLATDPINIQFTSGTTGLPKGACLSHRNILNNGYFVGEMQKLTENDRVCISVPMYHCFGMVMGSLACMTHGSGMIFPSATFDPLSSLQAAAEKKATALYGVPTMFIAMLTHDRFDEFKQTLKDNVRTGIASGSPVPAELLKKLIEECGAKDLTICYGMTETSPVSTQTTLSDSFDARVFTVGRTHPHLETKICDEEGNVVPIGMVGEIHTRGYSVMLGYYNDKGLDTEATNKVISKDGWMATGDQGQMDDQGYVKIVGRIKDMIIRGGENVFPREIEEVLARHPLLLDAQVVGVPDTFMGEEVCVRLRVHNRDQIQRIQSENPHLTSKFASAMDVAMDVAEFCRDQLALYKVPRYFQVVESYPLTVSGKIQKFIMRKEVIEELNQKHKNTMEQLHSNNNVNLNEKEMEHEYGTIFNKPAFDQMYGPIVDIYPKRALKVFHTNTNNSNHSHNPFTQS